MSCFQRAHATPTALCCLLVWALAPISETHAQASTFYFEQTLQHPNHPAIGGGVIAATADFDNDGAAELAIASRGAASWAYMGGPSEWGSASVYSFVGMFPGPPIGMTQVKTGDFDGDGNQDVVLVGDIIGPSVLIYIGDGTGNFTPPAGPLPISGYTLFLAVGDFDNDGRSDLVLTSNPAPAPNGSLIPLYRRVLLSRWPAWQDAGIVADTFGAAATTVMTGDYDGDGNTDVAFGSRARYGGGVRVAYGDGSGAFLASTHVNNAQMGGGFTYDVDGDGIDDMVAAELLISGGNRLVVRYGTPRRRLYEQRLDPFPSQFLAISAGIYVDDVDLDGRPDVIFTTFLYPPPYPLTLASTTIHTIYKNEGGRRFSAPTMDLVPPTVSTFAAVPLLTIADFDGDGDGDWVEHYGTPTLNYYTNRARYHLGCAGSGTTIPQMTLSSTTIGRPMTIGVEAAPLNMPGWLAVSSASIPAASACVAVDLSAPGTFIVPLATGPAGAGGVTFSIPALPALRGTTLFTQWGGVDAGNQLVLSDARTIILW